MRSRGREPGSASGRLPGTDRSLPIFSDSLRTLESRNTDLRKLWLRGRKQRQRDRIQEPSQPTHAEVPAMRYQPTEASPVTPDEGAKEFGFDTVENAKAAAIVAKALDHPFVIEPAVVILSGKNLATYNERCADGTFDTPTPTGAYFDPPTRIVFTPGADYEVTRIHETAHAGIDEINPALYRRIKRLQSAFRIFKNGGTVAQFDVGGSISASAIHEGIANFIAIEHALVEDAIMIHNALIADPFEANKKLAVDNEKVLDAYAVLEQSRTDMQQAFGEDDLERRKRFGSTRIGNEVHTFGYSFVLSITKQLRADGIDEDQLPRWIHLLAENAPTQLEEFLDPSGYAQWLQTQFRTASDVPLEKSKTAVSPYAKLITGENFITRRDAFSNLLAEAVTRAPIVEKGSYRRPTYKPRERTSFIPSKEMLTNLGDQHLTEFGRTLQDIVRGRTVIDLGCGDPEFSQIPLVVSLAMGAREYIGVDIKTDGFEQSTLRTELTSGMPVSYRQNDILAFLAQLSPQDGVVFHLAGMEPESSKDPVTQQYIAASLKEIQRVTRTGDAIIIGAATIGFHPENYGFTLRQTTKTTNRYGDEFTSQRLYVKE